MPYHVHVEARRGRPPSGHRDLRRARDGRGYRTHSLPLSVPRDTVGSREQLGRPHAWIRSRPPDDADPTQPPAPSSCLEYEKRTTCPLSTTLGERAGARQARPKGLVGRPGCWSSGGCLSVFPRSRRFARRVRHAGPHGRWRASSQRAIAPTPRPLLPSTRRGRLSQHPTASAPVSSATFATVRPRR
jgi:hypothetical protein